MKCNASERKKEKKKRRLHGPSDHRRGIALAPKYLCSGSHSDKPDRALSGRGFPRLLKQQLLFTFPSNVNHHRHPKPGSQTSTTALIKHPGTCSTFATPLACRQMSKCQTCTVLFFCFSVKAPYSRNQANRQKNNIIVLSVRDLSRNNCK